MAVKKMNLSFSIFDIFYQLSSLVCHQLPERTLTINGHLLPLCARCTGIYSGFIIGIIYQVVVLRKINQLPSPRIVSILSATIIFLFIDGVGEKMHLWNLSNKIRLVIGLLCGNSISLILLPLFNHFFTKQLQQLSINIKHYLALLILVISIYLMHYSPLSYIFFYFLSLIGLVVMYVAFNATFAGMIFKINKKTLDITYTVLIIMVSMVLFAGEGILLKILH
jgi:uncharacterized membrane protein